MMAGLIKKSMRVGIILACALLSIAFTTFDRRRLPGWSHDVDEVLELPTVKAFLDTISFAEGTFHSEGYYVLYADHRFSNFQDHPRCVIASKAYSTGQKGYSGLNSSAAGRYQILQKTWDVISRQMRLKDFGPKNQDRAAIGLIRSMGALKDVIAGRLEVACKKLARVWSCLPHATYGQPIVPMPQLKKFYSDRLRHYQK